MRFFTLGILFVRTSPCAQQSPLQNFSAPLLRRVSPEVRPPCGGLENLTKTLKNLVFASGGLTILNEKQAQFRTADFQKILLFGLTRKPIKTPIYAACLLLHPHR